MESHTNANDTPPLATAVANANEQCDALAPAAPPTTVRVIVHANRTASTLGNPRILPYEWDAC